MFYTTEALTYPYVSVNNIVLPCWTRLRDAFPPPPKLQVPLFAALGLFWNFSVLARRGPSRWCLLAGFAA